MTSRQLIRRHSTINHSLGSMHPLLARLFSARGINDPHEVDYDLKRLAPFTALKGIQEAAERLFLALQRNESIVIVGDYDADGATSTAIAIRGLRSMGFERVDYLIPNRFDFGYGLSPEIVNVVAASNPGLIITVDNGIASIAGVARAREHGIDVIVTDHHLPAESLPNAVAIVNPNQPGCEFPSKSLAGVGVMFYVLAALRSLLRANGHFSQPGDEPNLASLLDLVALGTVADVVPLDHNNRILVEQGLRRIRSGRACPGILALLRIAGRDFHFTRSADLGFCVGPRLNAAGRLEDMSFGIECLLTDDPSQAERYARELDHLNRARREIQSDMQQQALSICESVHLDGDLPWGLALLHEGWHEGVVGLVAGKIKEQYHRPVVAFSTSSNGLLKGSARSIPGLHIRDALERVDAQNPGMISKYGGHAMAAGLSLAADRFDDFRRAFDCAVRDMLSADDLDPVIVSDGDPGASQLDMETARLIEDCGPWGQGFPEPIFDGKFVIAQRQVLKERHLRFTLRAQGADRPVSAIAFNIEPSAWPDLGETLEIAYTMNINRFRGEEELQLIVVEKIE